MTTIFTAEQLIEAVESTRDECYQQRNYCDQNDEAMIYRVVGDMFDNLLDRLKAKLP